jgi:uncharacterized protein (UPF0333 family)
MFLNVDRRCLMFKRFFKWVVPYLVFALIMCGSWYALAQSVSSTLRTAGSAAISTSTAKLFGVCIYTDGTNAATLKLYDNASAATGKQVFNAYVPGATGTICPQWESSLRIVNGIYAVFTGTNASYNIFYSK